MVPDTDPEIKKSTTDIPVGFTSPEPIYEDGSCYANAVIPGGDAGSKAWARNGYEVGQETAILRAIHTAALLRVYIETGGSRTASDALATLIILLSEQL